MSRERKMTGTGADSCVAMRCVSCSPLIPGRSISVINKSGDDSDLSTNSSAASPSVKSSTSNSRSRRKSARDWRDSPSSSTSRRRNQRHHYPKKTSAPDVKVSTITELDRDLRHHRISFTIVASNQTCSEGKKRRFDSHFGNLLTGKKTGAVVLK